MSDCRARIVGWWNCNCEECKMKGIDESARVPHPDDLAVDRFAEEMKAKLAKARAEGRGGWEDRTVCHHTELSDMLRFHVEKGDPRDVANFCCFLWNRQEGILPASPHCDYIGAARRARSRPYFTDEAALVAFLDSLHATDANGALTGQRWDVAQRAIAGITSRAVVWESDTPYGIGYTFVPEFLERFDIAKRGDIVFSELVPSEPPPHVHRDAQGNVMHLLKLEPSGFELRMAQGVDGYWRLLDARSPSFSLEWLTLGADGGVTRTRLPLSQWPAWAREWHEARRR